jgi:hypothetical protein
MPLMNIFKTRTKSLRSCGGISLNIMKHCSPRFREKGHVTQVITHALESMVQAKVFHKKIVVKLQEELETKEDLMSHLQEDIEDIKRIDLSIVKKTTSYEKPKLEVNMSPHPSL